MNNNIYEKLNNLDNLSSINTTNENLISITEEEKKRIKYFIKKNSKNKKSNKYIVASIVATIFICSTIFITTNKDISAQIENSIKMIFGINSSDNYIFSGSNGYKKIGDIPKVGDVLAKSGDIFLDNNKVYTTMYISVPYNKKYIYNINPIITITDDTNKDISFGTTSVGIKNIVNKDDKNQVYLVFAEADGISKKLTENTKLTQNLNVAINTINKEDALKILNKIALTNNKEIKDGLYSAFDDLTSNKDTLKVFHAKAFKINAPKNNLNKETKISEKPKSFLSNGIKYTVNNISLNKIGMQVDMSEDIAKKNYASNMIDLVVQDEKGNEIILNQNSGSGNDEHFYNTVYDYKFDLNSEEFKKLYNSKYIKIIFYKSKMNSHLSKPDADVIESNGLKKFIQLINDNNSLYFHGESEAKTVNKSLDRSNKIGEMIVDLK